MADEENELEGIYQGKLLLALPAKPRADFKPWHKPRKHYLRLRQWCLEAQKLIKSLALKEGDQLRYFGLPGEDLLDLWVLKGICESANIKLRYIGFDSSRRSASVNLATHRVNSNRFIHPASLILGDSLQAILRKSSPAFRHADDNAPYDIINLDLCDSIVNQSLPDSYPNLEVVRALCDIQCQRRGQPWILFLTTRVLREGLKDEALRKMFHFIIENINSGEKFSTSLEGHLGIKAQSVIDAKNPDDFDNEKWMECHTLAFAKWLLAYLVNLGCGVSLLDSYVYNVQFSGKDMVSLGFMIEPAPVSGVDHSGMTVGIDHGSSVPKEEKLACDILEKIAGIKDVDLLLAGDQDLLTKFIEKKASLLAGVGYDPEAYRVWALS